MDAPQIQTLAPTGLHCNPATISTWNLHHPSNECCTNHRLIRSKIHLTIQPQHTRHQPSRRLNYRALKSPDYTALYRCCLADNLSFAFIYPLHNTAGSAWANLSSAIQQAATDTIGFTSKHYQDWFDDSSPEILNLLEWKCKAFTAHFSIHILSLCSHTGVIYALRCNGVFA